MESDYNSVNVNLIYVGGEFWVLVKFGDAVNHLIVLGDNWLGKSVTHSSLSILMWVSAMV